jgi:transposase
MLSWNDPLDDLDHLHSVEARIADADEKIKTFMRSSALCKKISAIDGVGP